MFIHITFDDFKAVLRDTGIILKYSSVMFLIPIILSLFFQEGFEIFSFYLVSGVIGFLLGIVLEKLFETKLETDLQHAFLTTSLAWLIFPALAALPFFLIQNMSFADSLFESMSALTTTGLTVMGHLIENSPKSLVLWRSFLSWIGGIGIVVLASLGLFVTYTKASKLIVSEEGKERLRPNLKNSVKLVFKIYSVLTIIGIVLLFLSGMTLFQAINYSMSAISTTGMDLTYEGLAATNNYWQPLGIHNYWVDLSLIFIMLMGATAFSLHYLFWKNKNIFEYFKDPEFKVLILASLVSAFAVIPKLGIQSSIFHAVSSITGGGFSLILPEQIGLWPSFVLLVLTAIMFIGGSSGSTAGGIKISRFIIFVKSIYWKIKQTILPEEAVFAKKFEKRIIKDSEIKQVFQFIVFYALFVFLGVFVLTFEGFEMSQALFEVVSAQSNVGISAGISEQGLPLLSKTMLILNMWIGRLEILPFFSIVGFLLALFSGKKGKVILNN